MSLPYRQQWQLRHTDRGLHQPDPHLAAMLAIFTRLSAGEKILAAERLRVPAWQLLGRLVGGAVIVVIWAARGTGQACRRIVTAARRLCRALPLCRVRLLRSAPPPRNSGPVRER